MEKKVKAIHVNLSELIKRKSLEKYGDEKKLTQTEISSETGIPQGTLSRWINGKVDSYNGEIMAKLMRYFGVSSTDELFEIEYEESA